MKKFFFGSKNSILLTLCSVLGTLMAFGLPLLDHVPFTEAKAHIAYWTILPVSGTIGLIQEHCRQKRSMLRKVFA